MTWIKYFIVFAELYQFQVVFTILLFVPSKRDLGNIMPVPLLTAILKLINLEL